MEDEAISGLDQIVHKVPIKEAEPYDDSTDSDSHGSFSSGQSESSHEDGPSSADESTSDSEGEPDRFEDALTTGLTQEGNEILTKGQRKRLLNAANQIADAAAIEVSCKPALIARSTKPSVRSRWRILELFTWSCMLSITATERGCWEAWEPISLESGWDVSTMDGQNKAMKYIQEVEPDVLMIAWPCSPWSPLQNISMRTDAQRLTLQRKRLQARRTVLSFTRRAALWQRRRGGLVFGENPATSKAWKTPEIEEAFDGLAHVQFDQCQVGLAHPNNHMPMRKRTIIAGEDGALTELKNKMCPGDHEHHIIEGGYKTKTGQWASLAEFAGGYPKELCTALLKGAEAWLTHKTNEAFTEDYEIEDTVPDWMAGEDYIEEQKSRQEAQLDDTLRFHGTEHQGPEDDERHPVSAETRKAVEFAHRQLGHPTRASLTRMLKLGGASQDALRYASKFHCSVCAARQAPRHPKPSTVSTRPFGFNVHLHLDLKYLYDSRKKKYVCLSILDLGTIKHDAIMLKNRRSDYVAEKFLRHWIALYGCPAQVTHDQGGEFEQSFHALLEDLAIPSKVTGAHAAWQLSAGERHGATLGVMFQAIVDEHGITGYTQMKKALSCAVMAKNATLTKDGYTPNQRVFGVEHKWPSLTADDVGMSFVQGLSADSEVARAHKMRTTARVALIRQDVRDKLRRTLLRKPPTATGPFVSGAQIYFWVPQLKRYNRDSGQWRGPATVLVQEQQKRYFVSWRGRLLLLAEENMRLATPEELALSEPVKEDVLDIQELLRDPTRSNIYQDLRAKPPPPRPRKKREPRPPEDPQRLRAKNILRGTKAVRRLLSQRPQMSQLPRQKKRKELPAAVEPPLHREEPPRVPLPAQPVAAPLEPAPRVVRRRLALEDAPPVVAVSHPQHLWPSHHWKLPLHLVSMCRLMIQVVYPTIHRLRRQIHHVLIIHQIGSNCLQRPEDSVSQMMFLSALSGNCKDPLLQNSP